MIKKNERNAKPGKMALATMVLGVSTLLATPNAQACGSEGYLGMICATAATYCPRGFALANGQLISINANQALFAVGDQLWRRR